MRKTYSRLFVLIILASIFTVNIYAKGKMTGGSAHEMPEWFKESFLEIEEDIDEAKENNKHVMLFLTLENCPYCTRMLKESFMQGSDIQGFIEKNFDVIGINIKGSKEIVLDEDTTMTEKEYAKYLNVQYTPTVIFFDQNNEIAVRLNGYRSSKNFKYILDFVKEKAYENTTLTKYLEMKKTKGLYKLKDNSMFSNISDLSIVTTPLAVIFEDPNCTQCEYMHNTTFKNQEVKKELSEFTIVRLDATSSKSIIDPDGNKTTPKQWAQRIGLDYRPGILLFDEKKLIAKIDALLYSFHFKEMFRYVSGGFYKSYDGFLPYLRIRQQELLDSGVNIDISRK